MVNLLKEFEDLFHRIFLEMKGIVGYSGEMNIQLKLDARPIRRRPYRLNLKCKEKVWKELDIMLEVRIIFSIEESEWISPMVIHDKKTREIRICIDLRHLNVPCVHETLLNYSQFRSWKM